MKSEILSALYIIICFQCGSKPEIVEVPFAEFSADTTMLANTINSIKKFEDIFLISYFDDYNHRLEWMHNYFLAQKDTAFQPSGCSLFSVSGDSGKIYFGRNFDDKNCSILLGKYTAPGKFRSFSFSRLEDLRFNRNMQIQDFSEKQIEEFLCFPFLAEDGMNEHGLAIAVASVKPQRIIEKENREPIFILLFIRKVLDECKTVEEVISFSKQYYIYDNSLSTNAHHLLVADSTGKHLVIEYANGRMNFIQAKRNFEIITNYPVSNKTPEEMKFCWRYKTILDNFQDSAEALNKFRSMKLLEDVYDGTTWSVVFDLNSKSGTFAKYGHYNKYYKFGF